MATFIKIRTYAKSDEELWLDEWANPLQGHLLVTPEVIRDLQRSVEDNKMSATYVDKIPTGFLTWTSSLKSYSPVPQGRSPFSWESESQPCLDAITNTLGTEYYSKLGMLWGQESNRNGGKTQLRSENVTFIKTIGQENPLRHPHAINSPKTAKMLESDKLKELLSVLDPLLEETDKFKQRSAAEILAGLLRGKY
jgi:proteasome activator subunit 4